MKATVHLCYGYLCDFFLITDFHKYVRYCSLWELEIPNLSDFQMHGLAPRILSNSPTGWENLEVPGAGGQMQKSLLDLATTCEDFRGCFMSNNCFDYHFALLW